MAMMPDMCLRAASRDDLPRIIHFLRENKLTEVGVDEYVENFIIIEGKDNRLTGIAGLETYGKCGLIRSVAVSRRARRKGIGKLLVETIIQNARAKNVQAVYLLTVNAEGYFNRFGFQTVNRQDVDLSVKMSQEFANACPKSASVMRKIIAQT